MDIANLSHSADYQAILETEFTAFLIRQQTGKKTISNYLTDLRQFMRWLSSANENPESSQISVEKMLKGVTAETIENYKKSMVLGQVPASTINHRFSTLRIFFQCAVLSSWVTEDPMKTIRNIQKNTAIPNEVLSEILNTYQKTQKNLNPTDSEDIKEFYAWLTGK